MPARIRITERLKSDNDHTFDVRAFFYVSFRRLWCGWIFWPRIGKNSWGEEIHRKSISFAKNLVPEPRAESQLKAEKEEKAPFIRFSFAYKEYFRKIWRAIKMVRIFRARFQSWFLLNNFIAILINWIAIEK